MTNLARLDQRLRTSSLEQYALGVSRHAVPGPGEVDRWFRRARLGDAEAHQRIVDSHLRFVIDLALTRRDFGAPLTALITSGNRGLLKAIQRYDPDADGDFLGYARDWIRLEMAASFERT